jgi:Uma2 family endonuclease
MRPIKDISQLDLSKSYTYADYLTWQFQERVELIMGKIFRMSPAPSSKHQYCITVLNSAFYSFLKGKLCKVFPAPFDVQLPLDPKINNNVVQPDITVICDSSKITKEGCVGAPDLVVEVVSKSSVKRDLHEKYDLYEMAGVKEYWLVNPNDKSLIIFVLDENGKYLPSKPLTSGDIATSKVLNGFSVDLEEVFVNVVEEPEEGYYAEPVIRI